LRFFMARQMLRQCGPVPLPDRSTIAEAGDRNGIRTTLYLRVSTAD
jgi:hypothetical protein